MTLSGSMNDILANYAGRPRALESEGNRQRKDMPLPDLRRNERSTSQPAHERESKWLLQHLITLSLLSRRTKTIRRSLARLTLPISTPSRVRARCSPTITGSRTPASPTTLHYSPALHRPSPRTTPTSLTLQPSPES